MKCFSVAFLTVCLISSSVFASSNGQPEKELPSEPDEEIRLEEVYDHESQMIMFLYSLKGNGEVDYVTGRKVWKHQRSVYGESRVLPRIFPAVLLVEPYNVERS